MTESEIFHRVAEVFGITDWPVTAVKAYVGHTLSAASGEQLMNSLGVFRYGFVPGIKTIDKVADDVFSERLTIPLEDLDRRDNPLDVAFLNSKGFGGNNATASVLAPRVVEPMLRRRYGDSAFEAYAARRESVRERAGAYDSQALKGQFDTLYHFGQNMIDESEIELGSRELRLPGMAQSIDLDLPNRYTDMTD